MDTAAWYTTDRTRFTPPQWKRWVFQPVRRLAVELRREGIHPSVQLRYYEARLDNLLDAFDLFRERYSMAKPRTAEAWQTAWVKVDMTEAQKASFRAWDLSEQDVIEVWAG